MRALALAFAFMLGGCHEHLTATPTVACAGGLPLLVPDDVDGGTP